MNAQHDGVWPVVTKYDERPATPPLDRAIAQIARRQHGVIALRQLIGLGLSRNAVCARVATGRLHRIHRGVYAVGHEVLSVRGRYMAAVLACGKRAVLSHRSAADLRGLRRTNRRVIEVTVPTRAGRCRDGIEVHASRTLLRRDVTYVDGIPCTSVARTLLDLAEVVRPHALALAIDRAEELRVADVSAIQDVLNRGQGRRGARKLQEALDNYEYTLVRSILEEHFIVLCEEHGLPRPRVNVWLADHDAEADFMWPDQELIVETDSKRHHGTPRQRAKDRRRDERLEAAGWRVIRKTWHEVQGDPQKVAREVLAALRSPGSSARRRPREASGGRPSR